MTALAAVSSREVRPVAEHFCGNDEKPAGDFRACGRDADTVRYRTHVLTALRTSMQCFSISRRATLPLRA